MTKTKNAVMDVLKATGQIMGGTSVLIGKAAYAVTSGIFKGIANSLPNTEEPDSDDNTVYTGVNSSVAASSNDDLNGLKVPELRTMARRYDYKAEGVTAKQIKGDGEGGLRKDDLISLIGKMRG